MSYLGLLGRFFPKYKGRIGLNSMFMILSALFSIVSFSAVIPLINMIFGVSDASIQVLSEPASLSISDLFFYIKNNTLFFLQETIERHGTGFGLMIIALFIITSSLLSNCFSYFAEYYRIPMRVGILRDLRKDLYRKILEFPTGVLTKDNRGDLVSRMTNDVLEVEWCVNNTLDLLIEHPIPLIIYFITLFSISAKLTWFAILLLILFAFIIIIIGYSIKKTAHKGQSERGEILSKYEETAGGLSIIRSFNAEGQVTNRFNTLNETNKKTFQKLNRILALSSPVSNFIISTILAIILWIGGRYVLENNYNLSGAEFIYYLIIFHSVIAPLRGIAKASYSIRKQLASLERINKILETADKNDIETKERSHSFAHIDKNAPAIEFENVSFSYNEGPLVLDNLSFKLNQGKSLAIVGNVGAGKTTIAELIMKLFDQNKGTIKVMGEDISKTNTSALRSIIGYVSQDVVLFNDTIFNNISLGIEKPSYKKVAYAAQCAGIHNFIEKLPEGYNTIVGDRGSRLSGGQKQQIALARVFLKNAPILILDEATSALDPKTAYSIFEVIKSLMASRTTLLITHDENLAANADSVIRLNHF